MNIKYTMATIGVVGLLTAGVVWAAPITGTAMHLYTVSGFVEMLIGKGIVPAGMVDRARAVVAMISRAEDTTSQAPVGALNADKVVVSVSQYIAHANRIYAKGDDVVGLILIVENTTAEAVTLEAKRGCQVVYQIFKDDTLLYDSATSEKCTTDERVTYLLSAGKSRMFEVEHTATTSPLDAGEYRVLIEYPGYGKGERMITITED